MSSCQDQSKAAAKFFQEAAANQSQKKTAAVPTSIQSNSSVSTSQVSNYPISFCQYFVAMRGMNKELSALLNHVTKMNRICCQRYVILFQSPYKLFVSR